MRWVLSLHPRGWRERYGEEFRDLLAAQRTSVALIVDLAAGAVDAWLNPQDSLATTTAAGKEPAMILGKALKLSCAGYGPNVTKRDQMKAAAVMVGGAFVMATLWLWLNAVAPNKVDIRSLVPMAFFAPWFLATRYTYLRDRAPRTPLAVIGSAIVLFTVFFLAIGRIGEVL